MINNSVKIILAICACFIFNSNLYAQRIIIEYFEGNQIVLYTSDYKLYFKDEVRTGFALPPKSVIETGAQTKIDLRIEPEGTIVKLGENSTLKIVSLAGYDGSDRNELKLITGVIRVIAAVPPDGKPLVLSGQITDASTRDADFGMVVRKLQEESLVVLKGEVEYSGSRKGSIILGEGEMANEFDRNFAQKAATAEYKNLITNLDLTTAGDIQTSDSASKETAPSASDSPGQEPTPTPVAGSTVSGTTPTPVTSIAASNETSASSKQIETGTDQSTGKESVSSTEPEESFPDTSEVPGNAPGQLTIAEVRQDSIVVSLGTDAGSVAVSDVALQKYKLEELYNVYKKSSKAGTRIVFSDFVDTVFLNQIDTSTNSLVFAYTWNGESKNMAKGYFLDATGRFFTTESKDITPGITAPTGVESTGDASSGSTQSENANNATGTQGAAGTAETVTTAQTEQAAQQANTGDFFLGVETGGGITYPYFFNLNLPPELQALSFLIVLFNLRGYVFADLYLKPIPNLGIGVESGIAYMTMTFEGQSESVNFADVPVRGFIRFGTKGIFIEAYGGYYFNIMSAGMDTSGWEGGLRAAFGGTYIDCAYVSAPYQYLRFSAGFALSFLPGQL